MSSLFYVGITAVLLTIFLAIIFAVGYRLTRRDPRPLAVGMAIFFCFAIVFERMFHSVLLLLVPGLESIVLSSPAWYILYGCGMAACFEESGRRVAFDGVLSGRNDLSIPIAYGIGHGGLELAIAGIVLLLATEPEAFTALDSLLWMFERTAALLGHIALSVIVYCSVVAGKKSLFVYALLLHALADVPIGLLKLGIISLPACDVLFGIGVALCVFVANRCVRSIGLALLA